MQVGFQFHAPRDELAGLLVEMLGDQDVEVVVEQFFPTYHVSRVALDGLREEIRARSEISRITLSSTTLDLDVDRGLNFVRLNAGAFFIQLGTETPTSLRQSAAGAKTDDPAAIKRWRSVVRQLKRSMMSGAEVVNRATNRRATDTRAWYTPGALHRYRTGTRMLAIAGGNEYEFPAGEK